MSFARTGPLPRRYQISPRPPIQQPLADLADRRRRQVREQSSQVTLGIDVVPAAGAGQSAEDRSRLPTAAVANE